MAKSRRGRPQSGTQRPSVGAARGRSRKRARLGAHSDVPTALPGAAQAPAAASLGGTVTAASAGLPRAAVRARGGPREGVDRHITRRIAALHDFRYVRADLRWVGLTSAISVGVILLLWAMLRF